MNQTIYNSALVLHIVGITLLAGATVIDYITFRQFWATFLHNKSSGIVIQDTISNYQRLMGVGMLIIIISGVGMMWYLHAVWGAQFWFQVKIVLLIIIIFNGLGVRRVLGSRLKKSILRPDHEDNLLKLSNLKRNISVVHIIQFILFLTIFVLSVFKFN